MSRSSRPIQIVVWLSLLVPTGAFAGMPRAISLTQLASLRIQSISFFVALILGTTWALQRGWNARTSGPPVRYRQALGVVLAFALAMQVVLAMISGARELMTPGAWTPNGVSYDRNQLSSVEGQAAAGRRARLEQLRDALWRYADAHGDFPPHAFGPHVDPGLWRSLDANHRYNYLPGQTRGADVPLVFEPEVFGRRRLVLFADGRVERRTP